MRIVTPLQGGRFNEKCPHSLLYSNHKEAEPTALRMTTIFLVSTKLELANHDHCHRQTYDKLYQLLLAAHRKTYQR